MTTNRRSSLRLHAGPACLFVVLTLILTAPLVFHMGDHVPSDLGDPLYNIWAMDQVRESLLAGGKGLWDGNIFFPHRDTLLYADYLLLPAILGGPVVALTGNHVLAYNLLFLASFVFAAFGMYALVFHLSGSRTGATISGLIFAFFTYRMAHIAHLELLIFGWLPLFFLALLKFFDDLAPRHLLAAGAFYVLQSLSCAYYGAYFLPFVAFFILYFAVQRGLILSKGFWIRIGLFTAACAAVLAPFFLPFARIYERMGFTRPLWEAEHYAAQLQHFFSVPPWHRAWGWLRGNIISQEWNLYPGIIALALAGIWLILKRRERRIEIRAEGTGRLIWWDRLLFLYAWVLIEVAYSGGFTIQMGGRTILSMHRLTNPLLILAAGLVLRVIWTIRRPAGPGRPIPTVLLAQRFFGFAVVAGGILSFGPTVRWMDQKLFAAPYALLYDLVPFIQGVRAPSRLTVMMMLGLAVLAGLAAVGLIGKVKSPRLKAAVPAALGLLLLADYAAAPIPLASIPRPLDDHPIYAAVRDLPGEAPLIELPMPQHYPEKWKEARLMYASIFHRKRMVNGYSGFFPPAYSVVREAMEFFPSSKTFELLRNLEVQFILLHTDQDRPLRGKQIRRLMSLHESEVELVARDEADVLWKLKPPPPSASPSAARYPRLDRSGWKAWGSVNVAAAGKALIDDPSARWETLGPQRPGDRFVIDFGETFRISDIELLQGPAARRFPRGLEVEISLDQVGWTTVLLEEPCLPDLSRSGIEAGEDFKTILAFEPVEARYLRLRLTRPHDIYPWVIGEVHVRGEPVDPLSAPER